MGLGSSTASGDGDRRRSRDLRAFGSSCLGLPITLSDEQTGERQRKSRGVVGSNEAAKELGLENHESCRDHTDHQLNKTTSLIDTTVDQNREVQCLRHQNDIGCSSSRSKSSADQSSNHSRCLPCPYVLMPERTGSTNFRARLVTSSGDCVSSGHDGFLGNRTGILENVMPEKDLSNASIEASTNKHSRRGLPEIEDIEVMNHSRHHGPQVPFEGSMRFSRTLSVGQLRDRVLRRCTLSEGLFSALLLEERLLIRSNIQVIGRQTLTSTSTFNPNIEAQQSSYADSSTGSSQFNASETSQARATSNHDLLEHRSAFLERRRRIRSQARALQRLGNRFENLSCYDRSCILSGQHRPGFCTYTSRTRQPNINNDASFSSSISRIVMLAEALFEVLEEIHQQSAALSPRSISVVSVPAPKEVVDGIPTKVYIKSKAHLYQEVPQCYICLVEYEDGGFIRILPCQHEFHQTCIDKWLKEIHRVCPVCRGDVCR